MAFRVSFGVHAVDTHVPKPTIRPLDGDTRLIKLVDQTQDAGWLHFGNASSNVGVWASTENMPTRARREGANLSLYPQLDFDQMTALALVSERARRVFDDLEPGVHQFLPVEVTQGKADAPGGRTYLIFLGNRLDTLDKDLSGPFNARGMCKGLTDPNGRVVLNSEKIGKHHAWSEMFLSTGTNGFFVSDTLAKILEDEGLTGLSPFRHTDETKDLSV
ncbi:DUF1629 domain-containing protein [Marivita sp. S6314]|uniref:DUF1629 domain-containing protein n=1 Tax=Marivita sp. S6314 TaxID=2926406 RepID=UPI001FF2580E|nr:DUF1629 domain-containing protein [Marivita sp. S6314]MCK0148606.1 DUF1629 domain-containing protein [Marivita sp. S6314]